MVQSCKDLLFPHPISALIQSNMKENIFPLLTINTPLAPNWVWRSKERIFTPSVITKLTGLQSEKTNHKSLRAQVSNGQGGKRFYVLLQRSCMIICFLTAVSELTFCKTSLNSSTPVLYFMRTHPIYCFNYSYHIVLNITSLHSE